MKKKFNRFITALALFTVSASNSIASICISDQIMQKPFREQCKEWINDKNGGKEAVEILKSRVLGELEQEDVCKKISANLFNTHCFIYTKSCKFNLESDGKPGKVDMGTSLNLRSLDLGKYGQKSEEIRKKLFKLVSTLDSFIEVDLSNNNLKDTDLCELNPMNTNISGIKDSNIISLVLSDNPGLTTLEALRDGFPNLLNLEVSNANLQNIKFSIINRGKRTMLGLDLSNNPSLGKSFCNKRNLKNTDNSDNAFFTKGWSLINVSNSGFTCLDHFLSWGSAGLREDLLYLILDGNRFNPPGFINRKLSHNLNYLQFLSAENSKNFPFELLFEKKEEPNFPALKLLNLKKARRLKTIMTLGKPIGVPIPISHELIKKSFQNDKCLLSDIESILPTLVEGDPPTIVSRYPQECLANQTPGVVIMP